MSLTETVDLRDRTDVGWRPAQELVLREIQSQGGALFMTEPFDEPVDVAGRLRGELDFTINQYDVDLVVMLYELTSDGEYVKLFEPGLCLPCELRSGPCPPPPAPGRRKAAATVSEREDGRPPAGRPAAGWC